MIAGRGIALEVRQVSGNRFSRLYHLMEPRDADIIQLFQRYTRIRVFFSTMAAASLIKWSRKVSNCAYRQGDRFGQAARSVNQSQ
jgi:hypothetical protein